MSFVMSEVVGWRPSRILRAVRNPNPGVRTARPADRRVPWVEGHRPKQGAGRGMHLPASLARRRRVHARAENGILFPMAPPHNEEAENEPVVRELLCRCHSTFFLASPAPSFLCAL